jgi:hypothetical protein
MLSSFPLYTKEGGTGNWLKEQGVRSTERAAERKGKKKRKTGAKYTS